MRKNLQVCMTSKRTDYETPASVFDPWNKKFSFTLDVCANPSNTKCKKFFTLQDDGLAQSWAGHTCWMNPPYGRKIIDKWVKKAVWEANDWKYCVVVGLLPARTSSKWWQSWVIPYALHIHYVPGRIKFVGEKNSAPFPSAIVIW
jgi:phage N-6-adenine-methyltransferase